MATCDICGKSGIKWCKRTKSGKQPKLVKHDCTAPNTTKSK